MSGVRLNGALESPERDGVSDRLERLREIIFYIITIRIICQPSAEK